MILKNTTGSEIELLNLGISIPASGQYVIQSDDFSVFYTDDNINEITTLINSGDIVVNDGSADLNITNALVFIQYPSQANKILFDNTSNGFTANESQSAIEEAQATAEGKARYTIILTHNGTVGGGTFFGYTELIPGNNSPIIIPKNSLMEELTFTNNKTGADYTIELRKNSTTATPFHTISKTNTQYFIEDGINESFSAGDRIYIKYVDDGSNARDAAIMLFMRLE